MLLKSNTNNYLLIKDDVGKSKPSVRQLPIDGHSYGYKCRPDKEGVIFELFMLFKIVEEVYMSLKNPQPETPQEQQEDLEDIADEAEDNEDVQ